VLFRDGHGVPQNYGKAVEWFYASANQGDADAQEHGRYPGWMSVVTYIL
jgi:TPR repeat protein